MPLRGSVYLCNRAAFARSGAAAEARLRVLLAISLYTHRGKASHCAAASYVAAAHKRGLLGAWLAFTFLSSCNRSELRSPAVRGKWLICRRSINHSCTAIKYSHACRADTSPMKSCSHKPSCLASCSPMYGGLWKSGASRIWEEEAAHISSHW